jgi:hypothetical protein
VNRGRRGSYVLVERSLVLLLRSFAKHQVKPGDHRRFLIGVPVV